MQSGYGAAHLDVDVKINGFALVVETKVAGRKPTARQIVTAKEIHESGTPVLFIDQTNLVDLVIVVDLLLTGQQSVAWSVAEESRKEFVG